jgi:uncharacterized membrane protein
MARSGATSLGLDERLERSLAYVFGWVSGLILFLFEKNRTVRWHALQSMAVFGSLSIVWLLVSLVKGFLGLIPVLNIVTNFGLGLLLSGIWWVGLILWVWLIIMAWLHPDYRLPYVSSWIQRWV